MGALNLVTASSVFPVSLEEAKRHLRVAIDDDDDLIQSQLEAASDLVELTTGRQLTTATWELWLDRTPGGGSVGDRQSTGWGPWDGNSASGWTDWGLWWSQRFIDVPRAPLQSVVSFKYTDTSGVLQTWASTNYQVHAPAGPTAPRGRIQPAYGVSWPVTLDQMDAVVLQFKAGYGDSAASVPQMLRRAILMITGDLYENREATVVTDRRITIQSLPFGVDEIMKQYRARPIAKAA